ncbi:MAG: hypothetical protein CFH44_00353 [Proteobacteria bacterium]|nr:MAG: hypothetical protein CFH44_00353 [Pseudomonadota bacterium]|tara:strand:- start:529 stop:1053 length:525 start_codon:yes stop_codon:yes gene_type:complete
MKTLTDSITATLNHLDKLKKQHKALRDDHCAESFYSLKIRASLTKFDNSYKVSVKACMNEFIENLDLLYNSNKDDMGNNQMFRDLEIIGLVKLPKDPEQYVCVDSVFEQMKDCLSNILSIENEERKPTHIEELLIISTICAHLAKHKKLHLSRDIESLRKWLLNDCSKGLANTA